MDRGGHTYPSNSGVSPPDLLGYCLLSLSASERLGSSPAGRLGEGSDGFQPVAASAATLTAMQRLRSIAARGWIHGLWHEAVTDSHDAAVPGGLVVMDKEYSQVPRATSDRRARWPSHPTLNAAWVGVCNVRLQPLVNATVSAADARKAGAGRRHGVHKVHWTLDNWWAAHKLLKAAPRRMCHQGGRYGCRRLVSKFLR